MFQNVFFTGQCHGSYEPSNYSGNLNIERFQPKIRTIILTEPKQIDYYNKVELEKQFPQNINPSFINKVIVVKNRVLYLADFTNTIVAPAELMVRNKLPEGSEGTFQGIFYGTIHGSLEKFEKKHITEDISRFLSADQLKSLGYKENNQAEEYYKSKQKSSQTSSNQGVKGDMRGLLGSGCVRIFWELVIALLLLLLLIFFVDKGCSIIERKYKLPLIPPCDTIYVHDTIFIESEELLDDTIPDLIRIKEDEALLMLFDCAVIDHDIISVSFNDNQICDSLELKGDHSSPYLLSMHKGINELLIEVGSKGEETPCTVGILIVSKVDKSKVIFRSCEKIDTYQPYDLKIRYK